MFCKNLQELDLKHTLGANEQVQIQTRFNCCCKHIAQANELKLNSNGRQLWVIKASEVLYYVV